MFKVNFQDRVPGLGLVTEVDPKFLCAVEFHLTKTGLDHASYNTNLRPIHEDIINTGIVDFISDNYGSIRRFSATKRPADFYKPRHCDRTNDRAQIVISVGAACILEMSKFDEPSFDYDLRTGIGFINPDAIPKQVELFHIPKDCGYFLSGNAQRVWYHSIPKIYGDSIRLVMAVV